MISTDTVLIGVAIVLAVIALWAIFRPSPMSAGMQLRDFRRGGFGAAPVGPTRGDYYARLPGGGVVYEEWDNIPRPAPAAPVAAPPPPPPPGGGAGGP